MSYGADDVEPFKRVAAMVDKILKGTKPADIPVEQSTKFEFVVNLKTAKQTRSDHPTRSAGAGEQGSQVRKSSDA
jgi:putative ABC transport system substrate-binding protein